MCLQHSWKATYRIQSKSLRPPTEYSVHFVQDKNLWSVRACGVSFFKKAFRFSKQFRLDFFSLRSQTNSGKKSPRQINSMLSRPTRIRAKCGEIHARCEVPLWRQMFLTATPFYFYWSLSPSIEVQIQRWLSAGQRLRRWRQIHPTLVQNLIKHPMLV